MSKSQTKTAAPAIVLPPIGRPVQVRSPLFMKVVAGIVIGIYDEETNDVIVQVFPVGRDALQIPAIPYLPIEPGVDIKSAVWPAEGSKQKI